MSAGFRQKKHVLAEIAVASFVALHADAILQ